MFLMFYIAYPYSPRISIISAGVTTMGVLGKCFVVVQGNDLAIADGFDNLHR